MMSSCNHCNQFPTCPSQEEAKKFPHYGTKSLLQFLVNCWFLMSWCNIEVLRVSVICWTGWTWCGFQPVKRGKKRAKGREVRLKCEERLPRTGPGCCVYPGKATLALTWLHKHAQHLTPAQFPPYKNMGGESSCPFTKTPKTKLSQTLRTA